MKTTGYSPFLRAITALLLLLAAGCATSVPLASRNVRPLYPVIEGTENGWWFARFQIKWPEGKEPYWHMDELLAHQVISPVLADYRKEIVLWRFHRRAVHDQSGHQLSFIFYSSPEVARGIFDQIQSNKLLIAMKSKGWITRDAYDDTSTIKKPDIEDTSDARWSPSIKKSWPFFIMGVSQMWISLIDQLAQPELAGKSSATLDESLAIYLHVHENIRKLWQEEGRHALLHHLNALFGYGPTIIHEQRMMSF